MSEHIKDFYQWNYRPQRVERPAWFTSWPGGARIAVAVRMMHEWQSIPRYAGRGSSAGSDEGADYRALSQREYGFKAGIWRLLDMLDSTGVKVTAVCSGLAAELYPETVKAIHDRGHEVATHQWDQGIYPGVYETAEEERAALVKSLDSLEKACGVRPRGYMSQGPRPSERTIEIAAQEDLIWNGDYQDCDVPYLMDIGGKKVVSVGFVRPSFTDNDLVPLGLSGGFQQLKDEFDAHYEEAARHPMRFGCGIHTFVSGGPGMARMWREFFDYAKAKDGVWFCTATEMAEFWLSEGKG